MLKISTFSLAGGQGKTTTALFLSKRLAEAGYSVLVVDADPQGNLTTFLEHDLQPNQPTLYEITNGTVPLEDGIYPTKQDNLFIIPADDALEKIQDYLSSSGIGALVLKQRLHSAETEFDVCIIDPPPQRFQMSKSVLCASDQVIIPVEANVKGFGSLTRTVSAINEMKSLGVCSANILGVLPFRDRWTGLNQTVECREWLEAMAQEVGAELILPSLREATPVVAAISSGKSLSEIAKPGDKYPLSYPFEVLFEMVSAKLVPEKEVANVR